MQRGRNCSPSIVTTSSDEALALEQLQYLLG